MRFTFRAKLLFIVGVAAVAFSLVVVSGILIARRIDDRLHTIQGRLLPRLELEPQLAADFERIRRGYQDAVAAHDTDAIDAVDAQRLAFVTRLDGGQSALDPKEVAALKAAFADYCDSARALSHRLVDGDTGEGVVDAIRDMQAKQARTSSLIHEAVSVDRDALAEAFAATAAAESSARRYQLWISLSSLALVVALSAALSRSLLARLRDISDGLDRFGEGDFARLVPAHGDDELDALARRANRMAENLLRIERERRNVEEALKRSNQELEAFSYSVAHDLRAPLRAINGFSKLLVDDYGEKLDDEGRGYLGRISAAADRMGELIDALLALARVTRSELRAVEIDLSQIADGVVKQLRVANPDRTVTFTNKEGALAHGDPILVRALLENLLGNAWKFTAKTNDATIAFTHAPSDDGVVYSVSDNGAGFDMSYAAKLFAPFQRLHGQHEFVGTGIGLATVKRIVDRHGGRVWAESAVGKGATFHFTLGTRENHDA